MNKRGFTLVELLAVIAILGALMTFGVVSVINIMGDSQNKIGEYTKKQIEDAATLYSMDKDNDCTVVCTFKGENIVNKLGTYYPEMSEKCEITEDSLVEIKQDPVDEENDFNGGDVSVRIEEIVCKE